MNVAPHNKNQGFLFRCNIFKYIIPKSPTLSPLQLISQLRVLRVSLRSQLR